MTWMSTILAACFNIFVNPIALEAIAWRYYLVFVAVLVTFGVTAWFLYPETKGYTLEQMATVFDGPNSAAGDVETKNVTSTVHQETI